jgi:hypothetical protein
MDTPDEQLDTLSLEYKETFLDDLEATPQHETKALTVFKVIY